MDIKNFIENKKEHLVSFFNKHSSVNQTITKRLSEDEILKAEIDEFTQKLFKENSISKKRKLIKEIVYRALELHTLSTSNSYIDEAMDMLDIDREESWFLALNSLDIFEYSLKIDTQVEIHIFKALLYELIENFNKANIEYKKALELSSSSNIKSSYLAFIDRANRLPNVSSNLSIQNSVKKDEIPYIIDKLEKISEYYARSKKSIKVAQKYYREIINLYEKLAQENPTKYSNSYVKALDNYYYKVLNGLQ